MIVWAHYVTESEEKILCIIHINGGSIFLDIVWAHACFFMCIILLLNYENVQALF